MTPSTCLPYRSEALRDSFFAYYDSLAASQWPVVSEERMVPTSYGPTFVRITGPIDAPPLVLLPGAASTSLMWTPNIRSLSQACRTVAVDQIGDIGKSIPVRPVRQMSDMFGWLTELFDALDLGTICLGGVSYGGGLAAQYAFHFPQRVQKAVLLAPANTVLRVKASLMAGLLASALAPRLFLPRLVRWMFADINRQDPRWVDTTLEQLFLCMRSMAPRRLPIPPVLTDADWNQFVVPTLFLVGEHEVIYNPFKAVRRLQRVAPHVTAEMIPTAGHDLTIAQAPLVNRKILDFLCGAGS